MTRTFLRWSAVPLIALGGWYLAIWIGLELWLQCWHLGQRPPGLCSDWWYSNHGRVADVVFALLLSIGAILLPSLAAPARKQIVFVCAFVLFIGYIVIDGGFSSSIPLLLLASAAVFWVLFLRDRPAGQDDA